MTTLLVALLAAFGAGQQSSAPPRPPVQPAPAQLPQESLVETHWTLVAVANLTPSRRPDAREPHLVFHPGGTVTGSDGCNTIRATYTADHQALKFSGLMGTLMDCPIPDKLDRRFREALVITRGWRIAEGELRLLDESGEVVARFEAKFD